MGRTEEVVLKRRYRSMAPRHSAFVDVKNGVFLHEDGTRVDYGSPVDLSDVLELAAAGEWEQPPTMIYIVGGWNAASTPRTQWFDAPPCWDRGAYHRNPLIAIYKSQSRQITIYGSAQWFGQCSDIVLLRQAYMRLWVLLRGNFGNETNLMGTPARTGLDLIERSLPTDKDKKAYEWPVLPKEVRQVIEHNIGQGRMEMIRQSAETPQTDKLYIVDAIWMYSSCCRRLPSGPVMHDATPEFAGYRVGYYKVAFQVPPGWRHVGILPTWNPKDRQPMWPSKPSTYWYTSYCCQEELRIAQEQNWPLKIEERWLFAEGDGLAQDPLRNWIEKLRTMRDACDEQREGPELSKLLRVAIRAICIKAIGGLHRKGRYQIVDVPVLQLADIPDDCEIVWRDKDYVRYKRPIPLDPSMVHFAHPEWSAYVWGRARARLLRAALELPREAIIALRSDAIVMTYDPGLHGTQPGEFRLKRVIDLAHGLPQSTRDYLDLLQEEEEEEDAG